MDMVVTYKVEKLFMQHKYGHCLDLCGVLIVFIYLGFNIAFNTVQVISRRVVGRADQPVHTVGQDYVP